MSFVFPAKLIAEEALRKIGAYAITDPGADPEQVRVMLNWLDLIMAHVGGTNQLWWLVPTAPILINLALNQQAYPLPGSISGNAPGGGYQFPLEAWLDHGDGNVTPLHILRRDQWDAVAARTIPVPSPQTTLAAGITSTATSMTVVSDAGFPTTGSFDAMLQGSDVSERVVITAGTGPDTWTITRGAFGDAPQAFASGALVYLVNAAGAVVTVSQPDPGDPYAIYIDRTPTPTLYTYPTVDEMPTQRVVRLTCQQFAPTLGSANVSGSGLNARQATQSAGIRASWQRWLVYAGALEGGSGTIRKLPKDELDDLKAMEAKLFGELLAFENSEFESLPLRTASADDFLFGRDERQRERHHPTETYT